MLKHQILDLLFKCKPLFKLYVWIELIMHGIKYTTLNKTVELTDIRDEIRIDGILCGFNSDIFMQFEEISEENIDLFLLD